MKFNTLYNSLLLEYKSFITNNELKKYLRFELARDERVAKLMHNFLKQSGYYSKGARLICDKLIVYDKNIKNKITHERETAYHIIVPDDKIWDVPGMLRVKLLKELWKYGLKTNSKLWAEAVPYGSMGMDGLNEHDFIGPPGEFDDYNLARNVKREIWEYDPIEKYDLDDETKEDWRSILPNL